MGNRSLLEISLTSRGDSDREAAHIAELVDDARGGTPGVMGIHGLPGAGKTSLIDLAMAQAPDFSLVELPIYGQPSAGLRGMQDYFSGEQSGGQSGGQSSGQSGGQSGGLSDDHSEELETSAVAALREARRSIASPILFVLDDCPRHLAPKANALGRALLSPEAAMPAVLVVTWSDSLEETEPLLTDASFSIHELTPLAMDQTTALIERHFGKAPDLSAQREIHRATGGNPSAILAACTHLSVEEFEGWVPLPVPIQVGKTLTRSFGDWVDSLPKGTQRAVAIAALACDSRPVLADALADAGLTARDLEPAADLGVLTVRGEHVRFAHPLCRTAAFHRLAPDVQSSARRVTGRAYVDAGSPELGALCATQASKVPDDAVATLCRTAAHAAELRSEPELAARFEMLGVHCGESEDVSAGHLLRASSLWQIAGHPERASRCLGRITPVKASKTAMGQATYRSGMVEFTTRGSAEAPAKMAAGALICAQVDPTPAVAMLVDAASSAALADLIGDALGYAEHAVELAGDQPEAAQALALATRAAVAAFQSGRSFLTDASRDALATLMERPTTFAGSPQTAYLIGSAVAQDGSPALVNRWLHWMDAGTAHSGSGAHAAAVDVVRSKALLILGHARDAVSVATSAVGQLETIGDIPLLARALGWQAWTAACAGELATAFQAAARYFSLGSDQFGSAQLQIITSLAHCELQRGRRHSAEAWLRSLEVDALSLAGRYFGAFDWPALAVFRQMALLCDFEPSRTDLLGGSGGPGAGAGVPTVPGPGAGAVGAIPHFVRAWVEGMLEPEPADSLQRLDRAQLNAIHSPMLNAHITLTSAIRQRQLGETELARFNVGQACRTFRQCGATGWETLAQAEFDHPLASSSPTPAPQISRLDHALAGTESTTSRTPGSGSDMEPSDVLDDETCRTALQSLRINLLGDFDVLENGASSAIPLGLAAQALKIVALYRRISVDELAEWLWPEAEPGVGTRRLRNILWRIKSTSGSLLRRSDTTICLEEGVITDISLFQESAAKAFEEGLSLEEAATFARKALELCGGELLPSDRYADWATGPRESVTQSRVRLLELVLDHALEAGLSQEALGVLENLIEADPFEERYYMQLANLHREAGNRSRMRRAVARGERMLNDLGVPPSKRFAEFAATIQS